MGFLGVENDLKHQKAILGAGLPNFCAKNLISELFIFYTAVKFVARIVSPHKMQKREKAVS